MGTIKSPLTFYRYIPENFDYHSLITLYPPVFKIDEQRVYQILSLFYEIPAKAKNKYKDTDGWIPIHSTIVQQNGIRELPKYREWLEEAGVIEVIMHFIPQHRTMRYRLKEEYRTPIKIVTIDKLTIVKALIRSNEEDIKYARYTYNYLYRWFDKLKIDGDGARKYLRENYEREILSSDTFPGAIDRFNAGMVHVSKIENKEWHFKTDLKSHRLHHNLSNIKGELRNFVSWGDQELTSLDIRNSQPVMSVLLLNPKFWSKSSKNEQELQNGSYPEENSGKIGKNLSVFELFPPFTSISFNIFKLPEYFHPQHILNSSPFKLAVFDRDIDQVDVIKYIQWVQAGLLYEEIEKVLLESGTIDVKYVSRKELKEMIFIVLFTSNKFIGQEEAEPKRIFRDLFPSVYDIFAFVKKSNKVDLPLLLQKIESELILKKVAKRIAKERRDLPIFTIHDSVITTCGNEEYVKEVLLEEIQKMIGITPDVSSETWKRENLQPKSFDN